MTTLYAANIAEEPPTGTVVVDSSGIAWQRLVEGQWSRALTPSQALTGGFGPDPKHAAHLPWPMLLVARGQVEEVWRPTEPVIPEPRINVQLGQGLTTGPTYAEALAARGITG